MRFLPHLCCGLVVLGCLAGCSPSSDAPVRGSNGDAGSGGDAGLADQEAGDETPERVVLEVHWTETEFKVLAVERIDLDFPVTPIGEPEDARVFWEFKDTAGRVVEKGSFKDPRDNALSDFDAEGKTDPKWGRSLAHTVRIEVPNTDGTLRFYTFGASTQMWDNWDTTEELGQGNVPPFSGGSAAAPAPAGLVKLIDHGDCPEYMNVLILPDGYTEGEKSAFMNHAQTAAKSIDTVFQKINVWAYWVPSVDSGISDPTKNLRKNTAFGVSYGNDKAYPFGRVHRCCLPDNISSEGAARREQAERASRANSTVIIANIEATGHCGCAPYVGAPLSVAGWNTVANTTPHELGHAMFLLDDEYAEDSRCKPATAAGKPNITNDLSNIPWSPLINTSQLPTTGGGGNTVGAFEGGGYCSKGVYRPQSTCKMRESWQPFCDVCEQVIAKVFQNRVSRPLQPGQKQCSKESCFGQADRCPKGTVCSWNGKENGYCCRKPFEGTTTCGSDNSCGGGICSFGGPPKDQFWCTQPTNECAPLEKPGTSDPTDSTPDKTETDRPGCTVGTRGARGSSLLWLALAAGGLVAARQRRRRV